MNKIRKNLAMVSLVIIILALIIFPHITPRISLRTHLFVTGHPIVAITSSIHTTDIFDEQYGRQYEVQTVIKDIGTGNYMSSLKVKKVLFLYFARYGEA